MDGPLVGSEIHGFHTLQDLDVGATMEEAATRWLRPNEIHAILCNYKYFSISVKPVTLPKSGQIVLFDRKMLRNFRKDGHNWKKKKDGKTVKEAHEHLKVGNEERIHVYYAHGQDNPTFVRRCYWLLDKSLEHIVLVHYRETQDQGSPATPVNSNSNSSSASDPSGALVLYEEFDSGITNACYAGGKEPLESRDGSTVRNYEQSLHDINTLDWADLLVSNDDDNSVTSKGGERKPGFHQKNPGGGNGFLTGGAGNSAAHLPSFNNLSIPNAGSENTQGDLLIDAYIPTMEGSHLNSDFQQRASVGVGAGGALDILANNKLHSADSLGTWVAGMINENQGCIDGSVLGTSVSSAQDSFVSPEINHLQSPVSQQLFSITDVSPEWVYTNQKTKILVTGFFPQVHSNLAKANLFCVCGDACIPAEIVQVGVYRCFVSPSSPGLLNLFMSVDGLKPISQVIPFECRSPVARSPVVSSDDDFKPQEFGFQMRLAHLLFSSHKSLNILSSKVSPNALKEAKKFASKTSQLSNTWITFMKSVEAGTATFAQAKDSIFKIILRDKLKEWLLERLLEGSKSTEFDVHGQGVIHLCAILGYTWAIRLYSLSGLSLDFRDKHGWTALHWAAYCGNKEMAAALLSAGAKPNLVTDPTSANPAGCYPGDIASMNGYDGLAAYLSEKALLEQFNDMSLAGNASGTLETSSTDTANPENLSEDQLYLKDSLAAYRAAADAAARIHVAVREHSLKVRAKAVEVSNPEDEARNIVAAMKIQHAFRNFETRKKMAAAAQIQYRFRTWKMRRRFLNLRHQTIKIQAAFRGFQVRRQYRKIIWSVGVVEKAILRWRLKRKGFRGLQVNLNDEVADQGRESDVEEDFYKTSQKQAEERVERSVVRVQALFRSRKAQQEYQMMKLAHNQAKMGFDDLVDLDLDIKIEDTGFA